MELVTHDILVKTEQEAATLLSCDQYLSCGTLQVDEDSWVGALQDVEVEQDGFIPEIWRKQGGLV